MAEGSPDPRRSRAPPAGTIVAVYGIGDSTRLARDAFYVSVGFGVLGFQKLQVRRRELEKELAKVRDEGVGTHVSRLVGAVRPD